MKELDENPLLLIEEMQERFNKKIDYCLSAKQIIKEIDLAPDIEKNKDAYLFFSLMGKLDKVYFISKRLGIYIRNLTLSEIKKIVTSSEDKMPHVFPYQYRFTKDHEKSLKMFVEHEHIKINDYDSKKEKVLAELILFCKSIIVVDVKETDKIIEMNDKYCDMLGEFNYDIESVDDVNGKISIFINYFMKVFSALSYNNNTFLSIYEVKANYFYPDRSHLNKIIGAYLGSELIGLKLYLNFIESNNLIDKFFTNEKLWFKFIKISKTLVVKNEENDLDSIQSYITVLQSLIAPYDENVTKQFIDNICYCVVEELQIKDNTLIKKTKKELRNIYNLRSRKSHGNEKREKSAFDKLNTFYQNYPKYKNADGKRMYNESLLEIVAERINTYFKIVCSFYLNNQDKITRLLNNYSIIKKEVNMKRITKNINNNYFISEDDIIKEMNGYTGKAVNALARYENAYEEMINYQKIIEEELEKLKGRGREKSVQFRETLARKIMNKTIIEMFERYLND